MITTFDHLCALDCSPDYWADIALDQAIEILDKFEDEDWRVLLELSSTRPNLWLKRCAEALGGDDSAKAFILLLQLCKHPDSNIVTAALDSLNAILRVRPVLLINEGHRMQIQTSIDALVAHLQSTPSLPTTKMLQTLQQKLSN